MRHFAVRYTRPKALEAAGYPKAIGVPFILDSRPGYHRCASRYLLDRALGVWSPKNPDGRESTFRPTKTTLKDYAHWLANFLEWAERRGVALEACNYSDHVFGRYQPELMTGVWSRDARGLSPQTINLYVGQACDFLAWMAFKGLRSPFYVPTTATRIRADSATDAHGHRSVGVASRQGKVKHVKRRLRMPSDEELQRWVASVHAKRGSTMGLMIETVLHSAMRRSEVLALRVDTLPRNESDWHISNPTAAESEQQVLIAIRFGTKGPSYGEDHGDKIGPEREINIPLHLARHIHQYRETVRPKALKNWVNQVRGAAAQKKRRDDSVHLFLDEKTGARIQSWQFYDAWKAGDLPFAGWSPHLGRDWWACATLWRDIKWHEQFTGKGTPGALLAALGTNVIRLRIQPQLGHKREETCFIYLQWVADMLGIALPEQYQRHLDASEDDDGDD